MGFNENNTDASKEIINEIQFVMQRKNIQNLNYLYPNCHSIRPRRRWFKGSRNRGLNFDIAA
tara:strand:- start:2732 stop:2917 length:186 start_codon:yes stop_codon:yes gene_type:complete